jgi:hypothetical protein
MNDLTLNINVANPPPGFCIPPNLVTWLQSAITLNVQGDVNGTRVIKSQIAPGPDQQDAIWYRIDNLGNSLGLFSYINGAWRRMPAVGIGTRAYYNGPTANVFDPVTLMGVHGGEYDGWQLDYTFSDEFVVNASVYNTKTAQWNTNVTGGLLPTGGANTQTLSLDNVPRPANPGLKTTLWKADGNAPGGDSALWGVPEANFPANTTLIPADPGNQNPLPVPIVPPFIAMAMIVYRGTGIGT